MLGFSVSFQLENPIKAVPSSIRVQWGVGTILGSQGGPGLVAWAPHGWVHYTQVGSLTIWGNWVGSPYFNNIKAGFRVHFGPFGNNPISYEQELWGTPLNFPPKFGWTPFWPGGGLLTGNVLGTRKVFGPPN